jgi:hypothetical protein
MPEYMPPTILKAPENMPILDIRDLYVFSSLHVSVKLGIQ